MTLPEIVDDARDFVAYAPRHLQDLAAFLRARVGDVPSYFVGALIAVSVIGLALWAFVEIVDTSSAVGRRSSVELRCAFVDEHRELRRIGLGRDRNGRHLSGSRPGENRRKQRQDESASKLGADSHG